MLLLIVGFTMIALTVIIHTLGLVLWLKYSSSQVNHARLKNIRGTFLLLGRTVTVLMFLHLLEAVIWAVLYMNLSNQAGLKSFSEAVYLSMITFTTLGYGDVTLNERWQILAGMQAMVGIVVFGFTTATLFAFIQRIWSHSQTHAK